MGPESRLTIRVFEDAIAQELGLIDPSEQEPRAAQGVVVRGPIRDDSTLLPLP
jgi:hypothetical protein